jgi:hypothetical protein
MIRRSFMLAAVLGLALTGVAAAVGPALPNIEGSVGASEVSYATALHGVSTIVTKRVEGKVVTRVSLVGGWGIPVVTLTRFNHAGLSANGRTLVLGDDVHPDGTLRSSSRFVVLDTRSLVLDRTITLQGDYSFDALSPAGRWLYLIHHLASAANRYQVRGYDLKTGTMLPGVIADKSQAGWLMAGYPVSRTTSPGGRFVYTLYQQSDNYPFVHVLDTVNRTAICIGLPWQWAGQTQEVAIGTAKLTLAGHTLRIAGGKGGFALDTRTFRVAKL